MIAASGSLPALVGLALVGPLAAMPLLAAGRLLPDLRAAVPRPRRARPPSRRSFPELLSVWASALRAGRSFAQALDTLVDEAAEPARASSAVPSIRCGWACPIEQALDDMSKRLASESFELVVLTTDVQRRIGGNVAEIFDQVAETVRKRQQFAPASARWSAMGVLSARVLLGYAVRAGGDPDPDQPRLHGAAVQHLRRTRADRHRRW